MKKKGNNGYFSVLPVFITSDQHDVIDEEYNSPAMSDWDSMFWYEIDSAVLWPAVRKAMQVLIKEGKAKRHHVRKKS